MINIAVCDDEKEYQNIIMEKVEAIFVNKKEEFWIEGYSSGKKLLEAVKQIHFDIVLLDIDMPEESGLIVADVIADKLPRTNVVFITNRDDLVYEALKCTPFSFIRKSCLEDLSKPLAKLIEKVLRIWMSCLDYITIRILTKLTPMEICCMMLWKEKEYALKMDK